MSRVTCRPEARFITGISVVGNMDLSPDGGGPSTPARVGLSSWPEPRHGWDSREPIFVGLALSLLIAALVLPWWGIEEEEFSVDPPILIRESVEFGPWISTRWYSIISGGFFPGYYIRGTPYLWWDLPRALPQYAAYTSISTTITVLWSVSFVLTALALFSRARPRSRMKGWPTAAQVLACALAGAAATVTVWGFPTAGGLGAFTGFSASPTLAWGPRFGWYLVVVAALTLAISTVIGRAVDRRLAHTCWFCLRPVEGRRCQSCGTLQ